MNRPTRNDPQPTPAEGLDLLLGDSTDNQDHKVINERPLEQRLSQLKTLGKELWVWYEREGDATELQNLGKPYNVRYGRLVNLEDLQKVIKYQELAVSLGSDDPHKRPALLAGLGTSLWRRFEHLGDFTDLKRAIEYQNQAILLAPDGDVGKPEFLTNLGSSYQSRFRWLGDLADIDNAIKYHGLAVSLRPDGHAGKPRMLTNLGDLHQYRFHHLGDVTDIDKAIESQRKAVSLTPDNHIGKPGLFNRLGVAYRNRAQSMNELADIENAIQYQHQAVSLTPEGNVDKPRFLCGLGHSYQIRFSHSDNIIDLERAIKYKKQAISSVPDDFAEKPSFLANLGNSCLRRFVYSNNLKDLDQGLGYYQQANMLISDGSIEKHNVLQNIGVSFQLRFNHSHDLTDVDKAIEYQQKALSLLPNDHAQRAIIFQYLGISHRIRFDQLGFPADVEHAIDYFSQSASSTTGSSLVAFESARLWITLSAQHHGAPNLDAYRAAIELIPRLIRLGTTVQRRYVDTVNLGDLITEAAAAAIALEQYACALEWLEEGRSIVWGQRCQLRTPMDELRAVDAKLANQLELVGQSLELAGSSKVDDDWGLTPEDTAQRQCRLAAEWSQLINQARKLPGFYRFMQPKNLAQLVPAAARGPVVVVNVHTTRCDALVLLPNTRTVTHIPLPSFSHKKAAQAQVDWSQSLQQHGVRDRAFIRPGNTNSSRKLFEQVLALLWVDVVEPVFNHLGFLRIQSKEKLPHITWSATGPLAFLPIHAAGCYNKSRPQFKIYDYAITSYSPTLSGLLVPSKRPEDFVGILAVAQEATPGLSSLPCAVEELERIQQAADGLPLKLLSGCDARIEAVMKGMEECSWVHLACHAVQDFKDPTKSALFLCDGKLSLAAISQKSLEHHDLAFLSACQTAVGHRELPEEAIHLAAGMIMAGYRTVIGTMWSIRDQHAPLVAEHVYARLLEGGVPDSRRAARALHEAVAYLRNEVGEDKYEDWAPFVHIGL